MSVIIITGGGKAAINVLQAACTRGEVNHDEAQEANTHIRALIALAKTKMAHDHAAGDNGEEENDT